MAVKIKSAVDKIVCVTLCLLVVLIIILVVFPLLRVNRSTYDKVTELNQVYADAGYIGKQSIILDTQEYITLVRHAEDTMSAIFKVQNEGYSSTYDRYIGYRQLAKSWTSYNFKDVMLKDLQKAMPYAELQPLKCAMEIQRVLNQPFAKFYIYMNSFLYELRFEDSYICIGFCVLAFVLLTSVVRFCLFMTEEVESDEDIEEYEEDEVV